MSNNKETVIKMRDVTKRFGEVAAVSNITLDVPQGGIFGFIGPSGCGKTTTVRLLIGNYEATDGDIEVLRKSPEDFIADDLRQIGYMPQLFILYPELTVWENLNFAASIYGYPMDRDERLHELLDLVELTGHENKLARNISGGMQRRLSLASTLVHQPELIFLDEPTAEVHLRGLDGERFGQHEVAGLADPARWVVGELDLAAFTCRLVGGVHDL